MSTVGVSASAKLKRRRCLYCGYDGRILQGERREHTWLCPRCGEDLYARPPRSYAEMEGLVEDRPTIQSLPIPMRARWPLGLISRGSGFSFSRREKASDAAARYRASDVMAFVCAALTVAFLVAGLASALVSR